jgi:NhaA family Na+:H+ antiporter
MATLSLQTVFRSERYAAISLAGAALLGLFLANSVAGPGLLTLMHTHYGIPGFGLDLSLEHWITDGLLVFFFFIVAIELRHELTRGELNSWQHALAPGVAAVGGVLVPAALYLAIAGPDFSEGWPIPTATDIAFALGLIALIGRGLPVRLRAFLLALAVLDDLIAILIIAVFFSHGGDLLSLALAAVGVVVFWFVGRLTLAAWLQTLLLTVVGVATWYFTVASGIHATLAGVALGLVLQPEVAKKAAHALQPVVNAAILPLFAFTSALVIIPSVPVSELSPVFWAITIALPLGKLVGITLAGTLVAWVVSRMRRASTPDSAEATATLVVGWDLVALAAAGGIGFTVSLLMNELAFEQDPAIADEGTLAVLAGSAISIVLGGALIAWRARHHRQGHNRVEK